MGQGIKNTLGYLGAILVILSVVFLGLEIKNRIERPVDLTSTPTVTMSAEGKVTSKPDTATISFSVVTQGRQAEDVQKENDKKMTKVIEFLKSQGVAESDIQTSGYNLYPQYNYNVAQGDAPSITGYSLNQQITAKIRELEKVSGITGGLTGQGVNQIDNVSFYIDDPDRLKGEARQQAVEKAKEKARELARGLEVRLGKVVSFSESDQSGGPYPLYRGYEGGYGGGGGSPVQAGTQDIIVSVTLTFELK